MKKTIKILIILLVLFPFVINASVSYEDGKKRIDNYIEKFTNYNMYLLMDVNDNFSNGGFLNIKEYNLSKHNNKSYLAIGIQYWIKEDTQTYKKYVVDYALREADGKGMGGCEIQAREVRRRLDGDCHDGPWAYF